MQDLNRYVAIAEEFPNTAPDRVKSGGLMHDRRGARVITPGTLIDENFMDPYANNYVMAIHVDYSGQEGEDHRGTRAKPSSVPASTSRPVLDSSLEVAAVSPSSRPAPALGLAWLDLSTGHFCTQAADLAALPSILSRVGPREVVLDESLQTCRDQHLFTTLAEDRYLVSYAPAVDRSLELEEWTPMLESEIPPDVRRAFTQNEVAAGSLLLSYVRDRLQGENMKLQPPLRHENMHIMSMDKNTVRALEIKQTIRDSHFRGSLLHAIRRTVTKSGARLLSEWLSTSTLSSVPAVVLSCLTIGAS